jgi:hypothetical protein
LNPANDGHSREPFTISSLQAAAGERAQSAAPR